MEKFAATAKVIDGTLILTLPDAIRPVVWQMQLGQTKSSALEVRELENKTWVLYLKTPRMDVMEIAPFDSKDKAVRALMAVSRAMEKAEGQLSQGQGARYPVPAVIPSSCGRWGWLCRLVRGTLYAFLALILLLVLAYTTLWLLRPSQTNMAPGTQSSLTAPQDPGSDGPVGAPVSADDYLNNR